MASQSGLLAASDCASRSLGWPINTTQLGASSLQGSGSTPLSIKPTDESWSGEAPTKRSWNAAGRPRRSKCRLASRKVSAGPAMSSSSVPGSRTKRMGVGAVVMG